MTVYQYELFKIEHNQSAHDLHQAAREQFEREFSSRGRRGFRWAGSFMTAAGIHLVYERARPLVEVEAEEATAGIEPTKE